MEIYFYIYIHAFFIRILICRILLSWLYLERPVSDLVLSIKLDILKMKCSSLSYKIAFYLLYIF